MTPAAGGGLGSWLGSPRSPSTFSLGSVAVVRGRRNKLAIFVLNLFAGWTLIGWIRAARVDLRRHRAPQKSPARVGTRRGAELAGGQIRRVQPFNATGARIVAIRKGGPKPAPIYLRPDGRELELRCWRVHFREVMRPSWHVGRDEIDIALQKARDHRDASPEPVETSNDQLSGVDAA